ncbi:hypothetical protein MTO96_014925 [Rhipicephalus appendiculatus]
MAAFQGRCNTKEPQQLSRPVRVLPAQSKDCSVVPGCGLAAVGERERVLGMPRLWWTDELSRSLDSVLFVSIYPCFCDHFAAHHGRHVLTAPGSWKSHLEPVRGVEGGGPEDEPSSGFTTAPLVRFCFMAAFQGRCNTKEPQPLSRPVWLLPAQSKDGPVALAPALSGGCMGVLKTSLVPSTTAVSNLLDDPGSL